MEKTNPKTDQMKLYTTYSKSDLIEYMKYNEYLGNVEEVARLEEYALWRYGKYWGTEDNQLCYMCQEEKEVNYDWLCEDCQL